MAWEVSFTDQFEDWWDSLDEEAQDAIAGRVEVLEAIGPALGRPSVDQIKVSRHQNVKELRASSDGTLRVLFAFDPRREAILLIGGNKSGAWNRWYEEMVSLARHLPYRAPGRRAPVDAPALRARSRGRARGHGGLRRRAHPDRFVVIDSSGSHLGTALAATRHLWLADSGSASGSALHGTVALGRPCGAWPHDILVA